MHHPIYLFRHGETAWNAQRRAQGHLDSPLTEMGRAQARALGHAELPIAVIAHPFGARTRDEVRTLAAACVDEVVQLATGQKLK